MVWEYSEKTIKLFMDAVHGKEGTHLGEIENADGLGEHGSIACGDALRFTFRVEKHPSDPTQDRITECRYLTFGCTSAIASSEALCAIIEGKRFTPLQALKIGNQDIVAFLEGLPEQKIHCSVMGAEALEAAVFNWAQKRGVDLKALGVVFQNGDRNEEGRLVCQCFSVNEPYIKRKIVELGLKTIPDITNAIKAGGACMSCHHVPGGLQDLLDGVWGRKGAVIHPEARTLVAAGEEKEAPPAGLSPYQLGRKVDSIIDHYIRPMLQKDGGDIEIVDIKDNLIYVKLVGACSGCAGAGATMKMVVERHLKDHVDERLRVISI